MKELCATDLRSLNESVLILNCDNSEETFSERLSSALAYLIPSDLTAVECFDKSGMWCERLLGDPGGVIEKHFEAFMRLGSTHPLFPAFLAGRLQKNALRISDVMTQRYLYNLDIFDQFLRPLGVDVQLGASIALKDGSADVLILSRKGLDYTLREKNRLTAFLPHIAHARRHASQHAISRQRNDVSVRGPIDKSRFIAHIKRSMRLTARESEIVWYLTLGVCDKDIANACKISQRTVQKHCENIYQKCGLPGRTAIAIAALSNNI